MRCSRETYPAQVWLPARSGRCRRQGGAGAGGSDAHGHESIEIMRYGLSRIPIMLLVIAIELPALGQTFFCRIGTEPACLNYGDTVCSSRGMCIDRNVVCFDQYQCNYEGFTCKSNVAECIEAHDTLLSKHNELVGTSTKTSESPREWLGSRRSRVHAAGLRRCEARAGTERRASPPGG